MGGGGGGSYRASGFMQWTLPFGAPSAANWIGMMAQRHFHEFGTTREQLAQIALNARRNAARNPNAIYRDPMTLDDYLGVRMVSTPLCLYDCDVPADGSTAVIVSRADAAPDLRRPPVRIEAMGTALRGRPSWDQFDDLTTMAVRDAAAMMWERTDLRPADVDVAELYDGFSFITLCWLEALGFCGHGEGGPFIEGGTASRPTARSRSTRTAASCPPAASTATASSTRRASSCGERPATASSPSSPRSPSPQPAAVRWRPACCSPARAEPVATSP